MGHSIGVAFRSRDKAEPYLHALRTLGAGVIEITPDSPHELAGLDGLMVTGGGVDIDPACYHQAPAPETGGPPDRGRDAMDTELIRNAAAAGLPLLCICRGMQMLNVVRGGTLHQHIPEYRLHGVKPPPGERHLPVHNIQAVSGTRLARILGEAPHPVNSRHHQAVDQLGEGLIVSARAPDGVIEAIEMPGEQFALGCQWHPEEMIATSPGDRKILQAFLRAAS